MVLPDILKYIRTLLLATAVLSYGFVSYNLSHRATNHIHSPVSKWSNLLQESGKCIVPQLLNTITPEYPSPEKVKSRIWSACAHQVGLLIREENVVRARCTLSIILGFPEYDIIFPFHSFW
ncbi:MAG: hypothetical protein KF846_08245 [Cyclobacteriaceae bacterium]|nr:hypothetical protein [Cyclobacteriaceae bacterium]